MEDRKDTTHPPAEHELPPGHEVSFPEGPTVRVVEALGHGSFGCVYRVERGAAGSPLAMKVEPAATASQPTFSQLEYENRIYAALRGTAGVPRVHGFLHDRGSGHRYLLMDLLGPNLHQVLLNAPGGTLPLRCVCIVAMRTLDRLRDMHARGLLHRDVKPQNFLLDYGNVPGRSTVWAVDFGLVKPYRNKDGTHVPDKGKKGMTGTPRFASIFTHMGHENSRRDDLESLLYMLVFLFRGKLPWQNIKVPAGMRPKSREGRAWKNRQILAAKQRHGGPELFQDMSGFPEIAQYVRSLEFDAEPDYGKIRKAFMRTYRDCQKKEGTKE